MRQTSSSGSAKATWLDREKAIEVLKGLAAEAGAAFPEIREIRLFGSVAKGEQTGTSDIDIFIITESPEKNPIERMRPYYQFFSERLDVALDVMAAAPGELESFSEIIIGSICLFWR